VSPNIPFSEDITCAVTASCPKKRPAKAIAISQLRGAAIDTVIITGGETGVCVMATMLSAIDWGFRVVLVTDALCSSADETHDAMMNVYMNRFGEQGETVTTQTLLDSWPGGMGSAGRHERRLLSSRRDFAPTRDRQGAADR
jgi:hypothetical protein